MGDDNSGGATGQRKSPLPAYYFKVEIAGNVFPFRSCSGLKIEQSVVEIEEGGLNDRVHKLPGRTKYPNIVLKQGFCGAESELYKMKRRFMNDLPGGGTIDTYLWQTPKRFGGTITQMGPDGAECKWIFHGAWICKWEGPDLDASKNEVSIETLEIAHEGLYMVSGGGGGGGGGP